MTIKGALHVHSAHSFDSTVPIEEIMVRSRNAGLNFVCITEHTNELDAGKFQTFLQHCKRFSTAECLVIPGLEITCEDGAHLLAFGLSRWPESRKMEEIPVHLKNSGALFVWAHPSDRMLSRLLESAVLRKELHGIELWNRKYHGLVNPHPRALRVLAEVRKQNATFHGYGGADFHEPGDLMAPITVVESEECSPSAILAALKRGTYSLRHGALRIPSDDALSPIQLVKLEAVWSVRKFVFGTLKWIKWNLASRFLNPNRALKIENTLRQWL